MNLTETDRILIARAREVGPGLRAGTSDRDRLVGWLLADLADALERLAGEGSKSGSEEEGGDRGRPLREGGVTHGPRR